jgi:hypothetical protein
VHIRATSVGLASTVTSDARYSEARIAAFLAS